MRTILLLLACLVSQAGWAASFAIRAGAGGANDGSDWDNAFTSVPTMNRGDVYYIAGGYYPFWEFSVDEDGTNLCSLIKATTAEHGPAGGWNDSYTNGQALVDHIVFHYGYLYVDGVIPWGIKCTNDTTYEAEGTASISTDKRYSTEPYNDHMTNVTFKYVEMAGPQVTGGGLRQYYPGEQCACFYSAFWENWKFYDLTLSHCYIHGSTDPIWTAGSVNPVVEHCVIGDATQLSLPDPQTYPHPNLWFAQNSAGITFRFNECSNVNATGLYPNTGAHGTNWCYGNYFHDYSSFATGLYFDGTAGNSTWYFHNNTCANIYRGVIIYPGPICLGGATNNIFYNIGPEGNGWSGFTNHAYNWYLGGSTEGGIGDIAGGSLYPFNTAPDIKTNIGATYPRNKGADLGAFFAEDYYGNTRSGSWDIGAVESDGTNGPPVDTDAPHILYGVIGARGTNMLLYFNEAVTTGAGAGAAWTLEMDDGPITVTPTFGAASSVQNSALDRPVQYYETVTNGLHYIPDADSIVDLHGNFMEATNDIAVVNNATNGQISVPQYDLAPGSYFGPQTFTVHSYNGNVYYTTNGVAATTNDILYTGPITLTYGRYPFSAVGWTGGKGVSAATNATYEVDLWVVDGQELPFRDIAMPPQSNYWQFSFDVYNTNSQNDMVIGFGQPTVIDYTSLGAIILFADSTNILVRNGGEYMAVVTNTYAPGHVYSFSGTIVPSNGTYSVALSVDGGGATIIATNYNFRSEQTNTTVFSHLGLKQYLSGSVTISNMVWSLEQQLIYEPIFVKVITIPPHAGIVRIAESQFQPPSLYWEPTNELVSINGSVGVSWNEYFAAHDDSTNMNINGAVSSLTLFWATNMGTIDELNLSFCTSLTNLLLPKLTNVTTLLYLRGCSALPLIDAPLLYFANNIDASQCSALASNNMPALFAVDVDVNYSATGLSVFHLPSLVGIAGTLFVNDCPSLTTVALPTCNDLTTVSAANSYSLATFTPNASIVYGGASDDASLDFHLDSLDVTSVNAIMTRAWSDTPSNDTIDVQGGANQTPTGQGFTDYQSLTNAGNTVNINP